jgi:hypothetical protein
MPGFWSLMKLEKMEFYGLVLICTLLHLQNQNGFLAGSQSYLGDHFSLNEEGVLDKPIN